MADAENLSNEYGGRFAAVNEIIIWDTVKREWETPHMSCVAGLEFPLPRFAHSAALSSATLPTSPFSPRSSVTSSSRLTVVGGQTDKGTYIRSLSTLDLDTMTWIFHLPFARRSGAYRSLVISPNLYLSPQSTDSGSREGFIQLDPSGNPFQLVNLPSSAIPPTFPPILVYNSGEFEKPHRHLDLIEIRPDPLATTVRELEMSSHPSLPCGIRFPSGGILGRHLLVSGLSLSETTGQFVLWAADLGDSGISTVDSKPLWREITMEGALHGGSWNQAVIWKNNLVVLGSRERDMAEDYAVRRVSYCASRTQRSALLTVLLII